MELNKEKRRWQNQSPHKKYSAAVRGLVDRFYSGVSRYTTSGFLRMKLGEALEKRGVAPHIFEGAAEAQSDLHNLEKGAGGQ